MVVIDVWSTFERRAEGPDGTRLMTVFADFEGITGPLQIWAAFSRGERTRGQ